METFPTRGDKAVRAQSIRDRMALLGLQVPIHESWCADLRAELLSFPAGKHDDQVDALGLVGQLLDQMAGGRILKEEIKTPLARDSYRPPTEERNVSDSILHRKGYCAVAARSLRTVNRTVVAQSLQGGRCPVAPQ
jgi:hypothetical protein